MLDNLFYFPQNAVDFIILSFSFILKLSILRKFLRQHTPSIDKLNAHSYLVQTLNEIFYFIILYNDQQMHK